jgi:hypothetical protein
MSNPIKNWRRQKTIRDYLDKEELLLSETGEGTIIDYVYQVSIHKRWLRIIAKPLIGWFSMRYWKKAVIDELRKILENKNSRPSILTAS